MKEITGDLWDYYQKPGHVICITTNGTVTKAGKAVMGRGCAREACERIPGIDKMLAAHLRWRGNTPTMLLNGLATFPVKREWGDTASLDLIRFGAEWLAREAFKNPDTVYVLPRPGCGNGCLKYYDVRPLLECLPDNVHVIDFARQTLPGLFD